ncbi:MAG: hypothetical protein ABSD99_04080 [Candidatus Bathyarchaeia archaeon]|jgi:hypothetical protein
MTFFDYFGILVAVIFGILSIYIAWRIETLIHEIRRSEIDEKLGAVIKIESEVLTWKKLGIDPAARTAVLMADVSAIGRIMKSMDKYQKAILGNALRTTIDNMKKEKFDEQAKLLEMTLSAF